VKASDWGLLLAMALLWSGSFLFGALAVAEMSPVKVVLWRFGLGAVVALPVAWAMGRAPRLGVRFWFDLAVVGTLNKLAPYFLICWALLSIPSGAASILNASTPLVTMLLAHALTADEKLTRGKLAGAVAGFAGVAVMIGPDALAGMRESLLADLACLAAAVCYAAGAIYGRRLRAEPPLAVAAGELAAAGAIMLALALVVEGRGALRPPSAEVAPSIAGLVLFSTVLASWLYFRVLASAGAANVVLVLILTPAFTLALGAALLGEPLLWSHLAGLSFIAFGLALIDGRPLRFAAGACAALSRNGAG
jgi:drug/metabolite transporter (DMT)-like permease